MIARFCKWYLKRFTHHLWDVYSEGWADGVDQQRQDPESTRHHITEVEYV